MISVVAGAGFEPRPSGYEPDELPGCSTPQQVAGNLAFCLGVSRKKARGGVAAGRAYWEAMSGEPKARLAPSTSAPPHGDSQVRAALVDDCGEALELFGQALAPLEQLGRGAELRPVCNQLLALVGTDVVVAVEGTQRGAALAVLSASIYRTSRRRA